MKKLMYCTTITGMIFFLFIGTCAAGELKRFFRPLYENNRGIATHLPTPCCETPQQRRTIEMETIIIPQQELRVIVTPEHPRYEEPLDESVPRIPVPEWSVPQVSIGRVVKPRLRRIDPSRAPTIEKYVIGEVACPLDLPKGGIVRVCNAHSGKYKLPEQGGAKYFHQQQCWFCENILGGEYVRWQDHIQ
ncbi:MAG: hypothetical protein AAB972_01505 [Patescibacteria group bacterium]